MKREIETINKNQEEMKNTTFEIKYTLEGFTHNWIKQRTELVSWKTRYK